MTNTLRLTVESVTQINTTMGDFDFLRSRQVSHLREIIKAGKMPYAINEKGRGLFDSVAELARFLSTSGADFIVLGPGWEIDLDIAQMLNGIGELA